MRERAWHSLCKALDCTATTTLSLTMSSGPVSPPIPVSVSTSVPIAAGTGTGTIPALASFTGAVPTPASARSQNVFVLWWRKIGAGSLLLSIAIHIGLLIMAAFIVTTVVMKEQPVDFLPGGGSKTGQEASQQLSQDVRIKKRNLMNKSTPLQKIVANTNAASISLPDLPMDSIDLPETSSLMGGGSMGSGGFGKAGAGGGFGEGIGLGGLKGMTPVTFFGQLGGDGLPGIFYDLKQNPKREAIEYNVNDYGAILAKAASKKFAASAMADYYQATQKMSFTFLAVPYMAADEGPKAFNVQNEVQPRGWFVHYTGMIVPPKPGDWRFVGNFDDALVVYINNKCVLDGSWLNIGNLDVRQPDPEIKQAFGGPPVLTPTQHCYAGKWVKIDGPTKIDILVGERPGGRVGGLLLVQHKRTKYKERPDGSPILPVFTTIKPTPADLARMEQFVSTKPAFELEMQDIPVFEVRKSALEGTSPLDAMRRNASANKEP